MKKKVIVLENIHELADEIAFYINKKEWDINVLYGIGKLSPNAIIEEMVKSDILVIQSTFDNYTQFSQMLDIIPIVNSMKKIPIEIHVVYTYKHFENFLNITCQESEKSKIISLLEQGVKIFDVKHEKFEDADKGKMFDEPTYFRKQFFRFDVVELFYNKVRNIIWHVRRPLIKVYPDDYYKAIKPEKKYNKLSESINNLTKNELTEFNLMLQEDYQRETDLKEDLETEGTWAYESGDKEELLELRNSRLSVMDKLGITSFK